jgi:hypothetical protein
MDKGSHRADEQGRWDVVGGWILYVVLVLLLVGLG